MLCIRATKIMQPPSEEKGMFGYYIFHGHAYLAPAPLYYMLLHIIKTGIVCRDYICLVYIAFMDCFLGQQWKYNKNNICSSVAASQPASG